MPLPFLGGDGWQQYIRVHPQSRPQGAGGAAGPQPAQARVVVVVLRSARIRFVRRGIFDSQPQPAQIINTVTLGARSVQTRRVDATQGIGFVHEMAVLPEVDFKTRHLLHLSASEAAHTRRLKICMHSSVSWRSREKYSVITNKSLRRTRRLSELMSTYTHTHHFTALFRDYPGEPVPER